MVQLGLTFFAKHVKNKVKGNFIDTLRLHVKGGHGGNGMPHYGGIGGQGGCVFFVAKDETTLHNVIRKNPTKRIQAGHGEESNKYRLLGRRGVDRRIEVPVGVTIIDDGRVIGDLNEADAHCVVAGGGGGGCSGNSFIGHRGEEKTVSLDLKLIADVGLVGFPNAGKSTLLKAISNASPKIASYPFTTIRPQIGIVEYPDLRQISVADLPGLIEGAHANVGMGHKFLKHIERTRLLLMVVDIGGFKLSASHAHRSCVENVFALNKELELYNETLFEKPCVLLLNKIDGQQDEGLAVRSLIVKLRNLAGKCASPSGPLEYGALTSVFIALGCADECPEKLMSKRFINFERVIAISAQLGTNILNVKDALRDVLDDQAERLKALDAAAATQKDGPVVTEQLKVKLS